MREGTWKSGLTEEFLCQLPSLEFPQTKLSSQLYRSMQVSVRVMMILSTYIFHLLACSAPCPVQVAI